MNKFRAVSTDQIHWYAQAWSEYASCYTDIKTSPAFLNPNSAIAWAFEHWQ